MRGSLLWAIAWAGCGFTRGASATGDGGAGNDAHDAAGEMGDATDAPPVDSDGDGIVDSADNCPTIANADQRDWDGDGHGDACDHCPHLPDAADPDTDGDGIGDACDPRPSTPGDTRLVWEAFYDDTAFGSWTVGGGTWTVAGGVLAQSDDTASATVTVVTSVAIAYVATDYVVDSFGAGSPTRAGTRSGIKASQYYDCAVIDNGSANVASYRNGATTQLVTNSWPGTFAAGSEIALVQRLDGGNNQCAASQGAQNASITQTETVSFDGSVALATSLTAVHYRYVFVVAIGS